MKKPVVGVIMGSESDRRTMRHAVATLETLGISAEERILSAHRTPDLVTEYAAEARKRGRKVIIAGAGGAAHLPGKTAPDTDHVPVNGVPLDATGLEGLDALLSIVQMPKGIPVNTMAVGEIGAVNAAYSAAEILAIHDPVVLRSLRTNRRRFEDGAYIERGPRPFIGIVGSEQDWQVLKHAAETLDDLRLPTEHSVSGPDLIPGYAADARARGIGVIITSAAAAARAASGTDHVPVIGIPIAPPGVNGLQAILSAVRMTEGIPVHVMALGEPGAVNAALSAAQMLAVKDPVVLEALRANRRRMRQKVIESDERVRSGR